ncbi:MAG: dioxygenase [Ponticaulis sp.]|nr:dioxygenase [Ponticaulis sp.]
MKRWPTYYIPHGGGPCFFMDTPPGIPTNTWESMADFLRNIDTELGERPSAVIVISAHWQRTNPTIHIGAKPELLYDYYGFPPHTYELTYPMSGAPELATEIADLLKGEGFTPEFEEKRGIDHGIFIPFKLIYPDADVPIVQLSMLRGDSPEDHIRLGRALEPLRDKGVLIIGSGLSFHNLRTFFHQPRATDPGSVQFDDWLTESVLTSDHREERLSTWETAPFARACHPTEEHLLPLMVAAGAAPEEAGVQVFSDIVLGKAVSGYRFGEITH